MLLPKCWRRAASPCCVARRLLSAALFLLATACTVRPEPAQDGSLRLLLLHTNDTMGLVEPCG